MRREVAVINKNRKVVQGNPLLELGYSLDQLPARIVRVLIAHIDDQRDKEFPQLTFSKKELIKVLGLESNTAKYTVLRNELKALQQRVIEFETGSGKDSAHVITSWIMKTRVWNYRDRIDVWLDGDLAPFLLDLKQRFYDEGQTFSKYNLEEVLSFRGDYTIRFFEWFNEKRWISKKAKSGTWYIELEVEEMRRRLGHLDEKGNILKLVLFGDFRRKVIQPVVEEISEKSDFIVSWESGKKKGRKVLSVIFHCEPKNKKQEQVVMKKLAKDMADKEVAKSAMSNMPWEKNKLKGN